ncbi:MAG: exosortase/archaeosortase family protein [Bryobacteraceae bacterium]
MPSESKTSQLTELVALSPAHGTASKATPHHHIYFAALVVASLVAAWPAIARLVNLALADDRYSHTALIPLMAAALAYLDKPNWLPHARLAPAYGLGLVLPGLVLHFTAPTWTIPTTTLSAQVTGIVLTWLGAFLLCYGPAALKAAAFPAGFLFLTIPLPEPVVDQISYALQAASAEISHLLFQILGVPVFRQGHVFTLPGLVIEVAEQCSGIRSTTALIISSMLVGYVFLRSAWRRLALVLATAFVAVLKNAIRIVFLSAMSVYVDESFLTGFLHHHYGGTVFSLLGLALLAPIFLVLRKNDKLVGS